MPEHYQQGTEQPYQPVHNELLLKQLIQQYNRLPESFRDDLIDQLEQDAQFYGVPFNRNPEDEEFRLLDTVKQLGSGFMSGFTTFNIGEDPVGPYERIARSVGHLAGFVGFVPVGAIGAITKSKRILDAAKTVRGASVPMYVANKITKKAASVASKVAETAVTGRGGATEAAIKFLQKPTTAHVIRDAFHLGVASSVSTWQGGIDEMMTSFVHGAQTGAAFRLIGNLIKIPGAPTPRPFAKLKDMDPTNQAEVALRTIASSAYTGLPATLRGATAPEQVYEYLLGAYFGVKMTPTEVTNRDRHIYNMISENSAFPETTKGWEKLSTREQDLVYDWMKTMIGGEQGKAISLEALRKLNLQDMLNIPDIVADTKEEALKAEYPRINNDAQAELLDILVKGEEVLPEAWKKLKDEDKIFYAEAMEASDIRGFYTWSELQRLDTDYLQSIGARYNITNRKSLDDMTLAAEIMNAQPKRREEAVFNVTTDQSEELYEVSDTGERLRAPQPIVNWLLNPRHGLTKMFEGFKTETERMQAVSKVASELNDFLTLDTTQRNLAPKDARYQRIDIDPEAVRLHLEKHGYAISEEGQRTLRQLINRKNNEIQVPFITTNISEKNVPRPPEEGGGTIFSRKPYVQIMSTGEKGAPMNVAGDVKNVKTVENVLDALWKSMKGEDVQESVYYVADHWAIPRDGWYVGTNFYRYKDILEQKMPGLLSDGTIRGAAEFNRLKWNLMQQMSKAIHPTSKKEMDLYYYGGVSDKERAIFMQHHPETAEKGNVELLNLQLKQIGKAFDQGARQKYFKKLFDAQQKAFTKKYNTTDTEYFKRSFVSNFLWDLQMNGFRTPKYKRDVAPVRPNKPDIVMGFRDGVGGRKMRPEFKGKSTMDLILSGDRISTSRAPAYMQAHPIEEGDIIRFTGDNKTVVVRATTGWESLKDINPKEWSINEGWGEGMHYDLAKKNYGYFMYEVVDKPTGTAIASEEANIKLLHQTLEPGFLKDAKGFNKRAQVWFTGGIPHDFMKIQEKIPLPDGEFKFILYDDAKGKTTDLSLASEYEESTDGAILAPPQLIRALAEDMGMPQAELQGQNKSFIISPNSELGALLGKYMIHSTTEAEGRNMLERENPIHFIIPKSAAKQTGLRKFGNYDFAEDGTLDIKNSEVYGFKPEELHTVPGILQDRRMTLPQHVYKQMFTNLSPSLMYNKVGQKTLDDMESSLVSDSYNASPYGAELTTEYYKKPFNKDIQDKILDVLESDISVAAVNDIIHTKGHESFADRIYSKLARISDNYMKDMKDMGEISEDELTQYLNESREFRSASERFLSLGTIAKGKDEPVLGTMLHKFNEKFIGRVMQNYHLNRATNPQVLNSLHARMRPFDKSMQKKFMNDFDEETFYLDNSFRDMRIYSEEVGEGLPDRNGRSWITLGDLWHRYKNLGEWEPDQPTGKTVARPRIDAVTPEGRAFIQKHVTEIFNGIAARVPIDSASGVRKLKFGGFTERVGHGILLHPRVMRALGGADLDGDEASIFFGGRAEDGSGYGFKESWKDLYHAQKDEHKRYYRKDEEHRPLADRERKDELDESDILYDARTKKGTWVPYTTDNKREPFVDSNITPADYLTVDLDNLPEMYKDEAFIRGLLPPDDVWVRPRGPQDPIGVPNPDKGVGYYSPVAREWMSEAAGRGRQGLESAASTKTILSGAHSSVSAMPNESMSHATTQMVRVEYVVNGRSKSETIPVNIFWTEQALTDPQSTALYRTLSRASIAFPSDPMDEAGLRRRTKFFELLYDSIFQVKVDKLEAQPTYNARGKEVKRSYNVDKAIKEALNIVDTEGNMLRNISQAPSNKQTNRLKRQGIFKLFFDTNNAYFTGRDVRSGVSYTPSQQRRMAAPLAALPNEYANTHLAKLAKLLSRHKYYDNMISRIRVEQDKNGKTTLPDVEKLYADYYKILQDYGLLQQALNRRTMSVLLKSRGSDTNQYLYKIMEKELWFPQNQEDFVNNDVEFYNMFRNTKIANKKYNLPKKKGVTFNFATNRATYHEHGIDKIDMRRQIIDNAVEAANGMLQQDIWDMISAKVMKEAMDSGKISKERAGIIFKNAAAVRRLAEKLKKNPNVIRPDAEGGEPAAERWRRELFGGEKISADVTQSFIDGKIKEHKDELDLNENRQKARPNKRFEEQLYDAFLAGSLHRGDTNRLHALKKEKEDAGEITEEFIDWYNQELKGTAGTSMSNFAFKSNSVSDVTLRKYIKEYNRMFNMAIDAVSPAEKRRIADELKRAEEAQMIDDIEVKPLEDPFAGLRGLKDAIARDKLDLEGETILTELEDHLEYYRNSVGVKLPELVGGMLTEVTGKAKDLDKMTYQDWRIINNMFKEMRTGDWADRNIVPGVQIPKRRFFRLFPEAINRSMMIHDFNLAHEKGLFEVAPGEFREGDIAKPTQMAQRALDVMSYVTEQTVKFADDETKRFRESIRPYYEGIPEGKILWDIAVSERERGVANYLKGEFAQEFPEQAKEAHAQAQDYLKRANSLQAKHKWRQEMRNKVFILFNRKIKGQQYVNEINNILTKQMEHMYSWMNGTKEYKELFLLKNERGEQLYFGLDGKPTTDMHKGHEMMDLKKFIKHARKSMRKGEDIPMTIGNSNINRLIRQFQYEEAPNPEHKRKIGGRRIYDIAEIPAEHYWPHMLFDKRISLDAMMKQFEKLYQQRPNMSEREFNSKAQKLVWQHHQLTGEWEFEEAEQWQLYDEVKGHLKHVSEKMSDDQLADYNRAASLGPAKQRINHMPGYSYEPRVIDKYIRATSGAFNRGLGQIVARNDLKEWLDSKREEFGDELTTSWENWFNLYINNSSGYPAVLPKAYLNDPYLKPKGTMYDWWADNNVKTKVNKVLEKLGLTNKDLPKNLRGVSLQDIRNWANLEAKYSMSALLFHPKTAMGNLYGGSALTAQSVGLQTFKQAQDIKWMKSNLNPEWNTKKDVQDYVISLGVVPEMLIHEAGINPEVAKANVKSAIRDAVKAIRKDPEVKNKTLLGIAREYGLTEAFWNKSAWFMRVSERRLRADSFMAHLIQAWKGYNGALPYNHPILIAHAKKGVKATQFLYNAPNRPMFSQTSLGKIFTRFQLWSWNSVRFRNDVRRHARIYGYTPGTPGYERVRRTMQADLFMLGLSSVFMYSLFEAALPAPWNWFQDTADWLFGDEKERDRAFFGAWPAGVAPLQMVTPVIARPLPAIFRGLMDEDWSKLSDYVAWTMLPMGRVARDIAGPNNLLENPMRAVEKITGLPYLKFHNLMQDKVEDIPYPKGIMGW